MGQTASFLPLLQQVAVVRREGPLQTARLAVLVVAVVQAAGPATVQVALLRLLAKVMLAELAQIRGAATTTLGAAVVLVLLVKTLDHTVVLAAVMAGQVWLLASLGLA